MDDEEELVGVVAGDLVAFVGLDIGTTFLEGIGNKSQALFELFYLKTRSYLYYFSGIETLYSLIRINSAKSNSNNS